MRMLTQAFNCLSTDSLLVETLNGYVKRADNGCALDVVRLNDAVLVIGKIKYLPVLQVAGSENLFCSK